MAMLQRLILISDCFLVMKYFLKVLSARIF